MELWVLAVILAIGMAHGTLRRPVKAITGSLKFIFRGLSPPCQLLKTEQKILVFGFLVLYLMNL